VPCQAVGSRGVEGVRNTTGQNSSTTIDVQRIKDSIDPAEFYRQQNATMPPPRRRGWVDGGLCPFHADQHAGSFKVNTETGGFHCFSCHTSGGDVIDFVMQRDGLDFLAAVRELAPGALPENAHATSRLAARDALKALEYEATFTEVCASALAAGEALSDKDLKRLHIAARRIRNVVEVI